MNQLLKVAEQHTEDFVNAYVEQASVLARQGGALLTTKTGRDALDALRSWAAIQGVRMCDSLVKQVLALADKYQGESYRRYFATFPVTLPTPWEQALGFILGGGFDSVAMVEVKKWRETEGFSLSRALWNYADGAQHTITDVVTQSVNEAWSYSQVEKELASRLTAKGTDNLAFNVRRLYVNEVNTAWTCDRKAITDAMPFVTKVELVRGEDGDPTCEICAAAIGAPGTTKIVDKEGADLPPYHPFCVDSWSDVLPTADDMVTALKAM
jgi:hypothetical protein